MTKVEGPGDPFNDASISITKAPSDANCTLDEAGLLEQPDTSIDEERDEGEDHAMKTP